MDEFERGFLAVIVLCGALFVLGYKGSGNSRRAVPVKGKPPR